MPAETGNRPAEKYIPEKAYRILEAGLQGYGAACRDLDKTCRDIKRACKDLA